MASGCPYQRDFAAAHAQLITAAARCRQSAGGGARGPLGVGNDAALAGSGLSRVGAVSPSCRHQESMVRATAAACNNRAAPAARLARVPPRSCSVPEGPRPRSPPWSFQVVVD
jgi:hypothetical protein